MKISDFFKKKKRYVAIEAGPARSDVPEGIMVKCPKCRHFMTAADLNKVQKVCPDCGWHHPLSAQERIDQMLDSGTFCALNTHLRSENPLGFPNYMEKIDSDRKKTGMNEAVLSGTGKIEGQPVVIAVMDSRFRMGSMGSVAGEIIARACMRATELEQPFLVFAASGGARMQEGVLSLMQMAKTSVALERHHRAGQLYISVMTHPTTGGVSASFASVGDINLAEPQALIGFAGRRVIEQTVREKLPDDFQTAEFLLSHGQLDAVVARPTLRATIANLVRLHGEGGGAQW